MNSPLVQLQKQWYLSALVMWCICKRSDTLTMTFKTSYGTKCEFCRYSLKTCKCKKLSDRSFLK